MWDASLAQGEGQVLEHRNRTARGLSLWHFCHRLFFSFRATRPKMAQKSHADGRGKNRLL